jgi:serine/threonine-protein kinase HipA
MKKSARTKATVNTRRTVAVCIGDAGTLVGELTYVKQGARENSTFAYAPAWLARPDRFTVSPDLDLTPDYQRRRAPTAQDSVFHHALADTVPDTCR